MSRPTSEATITAGSSADTVAPAAGAPLLDVRQVSKEFPGVLALDKVSLTVFSGEVHALVGENGAGKSTLVKVLSGVQKPDGGEMLLNGQRYLAHDPKEAIEAGIRVVYQELNLLTYLTVEENLSFESLPSNHGLVDRGVMRERAERLMADVGLDVPPNTTVEDLGIAQMQMVEIARALLTEAKLLILDEPTATLTPRETDQLFGIIRKLAGQGIGILFISHHLDEVKEIGDRVTVLRNGQWVATEDVRDVTVPQIIELMVGRAMTEAYPFRPSVELGGELLTVENLSYRGNLEPVSLQLHEGEILGVAGLVGSGRTEAMRAIFGADKAATGVIKVEGEVVRIAEPSDAVAAGIGLLTEDRKTQGLMLDMGVAQNTTITKLEAITRRGLLQTRDESVSFAGPDRRAQHQGAVAGPAGALPLGRQPAEGGHRQVALRRVPHPDLRRAHARHRRRRQVRDLQPHLGPRPSRQGRHRGLVRPARAAGHLPPHHRLQQGRRRR